MHRSQFSRSSAVVAMVAALSILPGCGEGQLVSEGDPDELTADADSDAPADRSAFAVADLPLDARIEVCHVYVGLNFRTGPSTSYLVIKVLRNGHEGRSIARQGSWYKWNVDGKVGWSHGSYLCKAGSGDAPSPVQNSTPSSSSGIAVSRDGIIQASKAFVGFSYWWGGARYKVGSSEHGRCYSSTYGGHSGPYGGDCSGYVGKVWQLPEAMPFDANRHPFSTYSYYNGSTHWSSISRGSAQRADAMVYNSGGSGHVLIYERGDVWGQAWTFESRGCSYGSVHNLRTIYSNYRARHRDGV